MNGDEGVEEAGEAAKNESANGDKPTVKNNETSEQGFECTDRHRRSERDKEQEEGVGEAEKGEIGGEGE